MKKRNAIRLLAVVMVAAMLGGAVLSSCAPAGVNDESTTEELTTTEAPAEEKKGCGSTVGFAGIALVTSVGLAGAVVARKKKD